MAGDWRSPELLPPHSGDGWAFWERSHVHSCTEQQALNKLKGWQPQSVVLFAAPNNVRFTSPVAIPALAHAAHLAVGRRHVQIIVACFIAAMVTLLLYLHKHSPMLPGAGISLALLGLMFMADYLGPLRTTTGLDERVRFLYWFKVSPSTTVAAITWSALAASMGTAQYVLVQESSLADLFHRYGAMYDAVLSGEYWRLLTGPYLHYSLLHFVNNFLLVILIGTLSWVLLGSGTAVATFAMGNIAGALGQMLFGGEVYDSCGGISFGIYALFGLVITAGLKDHELLPKGFTTLCAFIAAIGIITSELTSVAAATTGHLTGVVVGAAIAWTLTTSRPPAASADLA